MTDFTWGQVSDNLSRLNNITQQLSRLEGDLGGMSDGSKLRGEMKGLRDEGQDIVRATKGLLAQPFDR